MRTNKSASHATVAVPALEPAGEYPPLQTISDEDRAFLHYNPNTDDLVEWVQTYAQRCIDADRAMRAQAVPADPLDWPLPCDVVVGHGTMRKGVKLRTLVTRMKVLYEMATSNNADEVANRTLEQRQEMLTAFLKKISAPAAAAVPSDLTTAAKQALACMEGLQQHLGSAVCEVEADALRAALAAAPQPPVAAPQPAAPQGVLELAREALDAAAAGLEWYRDRCAEAKDGSDDQADELISRALDAIAAQPEQPAPVAQGDVLPSLFREALAWGMTYGPEIPAHKWEEMRESMVEKFTASAQTKKGDAV